MPIAPLHVATPSITIDGETNPLAEASLSNLVVTEDTGGMASAEIVLLNSNAGGGSEYSFFNRDVVDFGSEVIVTLGSDEGRGDVFAGRVTGVRADYPQESNAQLVLLAEDGLQALRMVRRSRVFEDVSDAEAIELVIQDHDVQGSVDLPGPTRAVVAQIDQSDLAFIRERATLAGGELWIDGSILNVSPRADRRGEPVTLSFRQNLRSASLTGDLIDQRTSLSIGGWDVQAKEAINVEATVSVLGSERNGGTAGPELVEEVFGARPERVVHQVPLDADEAQVMANARFAQLARRFVSGDLLTDGDARLRSGGTVDVVGLGPWFNGTYDVVGSKHLFDLTAGYRTIVSVERAELSL